MSTTIRLITTLALVCGLSAVGCTGAEEEAPEDEAQGSQLQGKVPQKMREITNQPKLVAEGKKLFQTNCIACHDMNGEGKVGMGPRLNSETFLAAAADELLIHTITKGREGTTMIPWGANFSQDQIYSIVAFIRSWKEVAPAELDESPLKGNAVGGQKLFGEICAGCHGASGGGYQETANGTGIGRKAFLDSVSNGFLRYIIKHGKSGTKMRPFDEASKVAVANLNDDQIENVIAYMRQAAW